MRGEIFKLKIGELGDLGFVVGMAIRLLAGKLVVGGFYI